jgi:hypothetical protein
MDLKPVAIMLDFMHPAGTNGGLSATVGRDGDTKVEGARADRTRVVWTPRHCIETLVESRRVLISCDNWPNLLSRV